MSPPAIPALETDRLLLRGFRLDDFEEFARIHADPEVMRFIGVGRPLDREGAWRTLAMLVGHWGLRGYGIWAAEERASGRLVGRIGLFRPEGWPGLEVGWLLDRPFWGRGLATEGARAALAFAWGLPGADRVISLIQPSNRASIRVAERIGECFAGRSEVGGQPVFVYAIERPGRAAPDAGGPPAGRAGDPAAGAG